MKLVLASSSPRRRELLQRCGCTVQLCPPALVEVWPAGPVREGALRLAEQKLAAAFQQHAGLPLADAREASARPWLAADTAVIVDEEVLGKPRDAADAQRMLRRLAGRRHEVVTGFVLGLGAAAGQFEVVHRRSVTTEVEMRPFTDREAAAYVASQEPMDKAGAYGVQGLGQVLVSRVWGSWTNVVGLPVAEVLAALAACCPESPAGPY